MANDDKEQSRRAATEARLVDSIGTLIQREGFGAVGVNAIARESGVNKALIYRYFGGLPGLYRAFGERADIWPSVDEMLGPTPERMVSLPVSEAIAEILGRMVQAIRRRPMTRELLAWECANRNELTIALEEVREARSVELITRLQALGWSYDSRLLHAGALLSGAINYFLVRGRTIRFFGGVDVQTDEGWDALAATWRIMLSAFDAPSHAPDA